MRLAYAHSYDIVRRNPIHEIDCAWAADNELTHVADIEQATLFAHRLVFGRYSRRVLHRHQVSGKGHQLGTQRGVGVGKWSSLK